MRRLAAVVSAALVGVGAAPSLAAVPAAAPSASQKAQLQRNGFVYLYSLKIARGVVHYSFRRDGKRNGVTTISARALAVMRSLRDANQLVYLFISPTTAKAGCNTLGTELAKQSGFRLFSCRVSSATQSGRNALIQLVMGMRPAK